MLENICPPFTITVIMHFKYFKLIIEIKAVFSFNQSVFSKYFLPVINFSITFFSIDYAYYKWNWIFVNCF